MIEIHLQHQGAFEVGQQVKGTLIWTPDSDTLPRSILVSLGWRTEGRGFVDRQRVASMSPTVNRVVAGRPTMIPFAVELPLEGPMSYVGSLMRIIWELTVDIEKPWAIDEHLTIGLIVVPRGLVERTAAASREGWVSDE
jgi:hypothetical protein